MNYHLHNTIVLYHWRGFEAALHFLFHPFFKEDTRILEAIQQLQHFSMEE